MDMYNENIEGGAMISGKWLNKLTGEAIVVRDSIMDGDQMILITDKGQLDMNIFSRDYVQVSDEVYDKNGNVVTNEEIISSTPKPSEVKLDYDLLTRSMEPLKPVKQETKENQEITNNFTLIDKLFNKLESKPELNLTISWADFPKNEINTLIEYLDVSKSDIAEYMYNKFANKEEIKIEIAKYLKSMIDGEL